MSNGWLIYKIFDNNNEFVGCSIVPENEQHKHHLGCYCKPYVNIDNNLVHNSLDKREVFESLLKTNEQ